MCVLLITRLLRGVGRWARKPVNHTSWVAVVTPTDRPKSVRNCCLIELFCGVVCVAALPFDISVGIGAFVIGLGQISSFCLYFSMLYKLIICLPKAIFCRQYFLKSVSPHWPFLADSETLTPPGHRVSHLMNVHRVAMVTVNLCFFVFYTWMLYTEELRCDIRDTLHKNRKYTIHLSRNWLLHLM